jgi:hypothetical protein
LASYFFDTSAFAKRYHPESGTQVVMAIFAEPGRTIGISSLSLIEIQSVFAAKVRSNVITRAMAGSLRARMLLDMAAGDFEVFTLSSDHFDAAGRMIGRHGFSSRLRTLDALQLAVALDLREQGLVDRFVVADRALGEVAVAEGLAVLNPEE